jgi:hypothetical protein
VIAFNRPPVVVQRLGVVVVPHQYLSGSHRYTATATLASFEDPDGDPLRIYPSAGDAACASFSISDGTVSVSCEQEYLPASGLPTLASFFGAHALLGGAGDGWEQATAATSVNIQDSAPSATAFDGVVDSCFCACGKWSPDGSTCIGPGTWTVDTFSVPLPVLVSEADGDPVEVTFVGATPIGGAKKTVLPASCSAMLRSPALPLTVQVTVDDGVARAQTTSRIAAVSCATAGQACTP